MDARFVIQNGNNKFCTVNSNMGYATGTVIPDVGAIGSAQRKKFVIEVGQVVVQASWGWWKHLLYSETPIMIMPI